MSVSENVPETKSMVYDLKPYPAYKDSSVPWLGEVPEHWEVQRGKWLFRHKKQINADHSNSNILSLTLRGVVNNNPDNPEGLVPKDYASYQLFRKGDLVFKLIDLENLRTSRVGFVHEDGIMSPAYVRLIPQSENNIFFFFHQYFDLYQRGIYNQLGAGVRSTLGPSDLLNLSVLVPSLSEQSTIVRYLDHISRRIRRYIRTKQKLIKLLEEQKQAIIHQAVTRGLDPNVRLKSSGVEWLGDVPEHWEVVALRRVTLARCDGPFGSGLKSSHYTEHGIRVVRLTNIGHAEFRNSDAAFISPMHYASLGDHSVKAGDVLIAGLGDDRHPAGRACVAPAEILPAMVKADCFRFRLKENRINPKFAALQLTATAVAASAILSTGATRQRTNLQSTTGRMITIPPLLEQDAVLDYISENTSTLNIAIDRAHSEISLLREYRTRLIADVVTGKLDVREAATNLPQETELLDFIDIVDLEDPEETDTHEDMDEAEILEEVYV